VDSLIQQLRRRLLPSLAVFKALGIPGAVASSDVTHVAWEKCPVHLQSSFVGKEGNPTVAYECSVDHHKNILHVTDGHPVHEMMSQSFDSMTSS
jgi:hypothetical protein